MILTPIGSRCIHCLQSQGVIAVVLALHFERWVLSVERWVFNFEYRVLNVERWVLNVEYWVLSVARWTLSVERWALNVQCLALNEVQEVLNRCGTSVECWALNFERGVFNIERWTLSVEYWALNFERGVLNIARWAMIVERWFVPGRALVRPVVRGGDRWEIGQAAVIMRLLRSTNHKYWHWIPRSPNCDPSMRIITSTRHARGQRPNRRTHHQSQPCHALGAVHLENSAKFAFLAYIYLS